MLLGKELQDKVQQNRILDTLFGLYPIYILFALTSIVFSNYQFIDSVGFYLMVVVTAYTIVLLIYNIISGSLRCNKVIGVSFMLFCLFSLISYMVVRDPNSTARDIALMIPVNGLVLGAPHADYDRDRRFKPFMVTLVVFTIAVTIWDIGSLIVEYHNLGVTRIKGLSGHIMRFGELVSIGLCLQTVVLIYLKKPIFRILTAIAIIINATALYFSLNRGPLVGLFAGLFIIALAFSLKLLPRRYVAIGVTALVVILLLFVVAILYMRMGGIDMVFSYDALNTLSSHRIEIWRTGFEMAAERPFSGYTIAEIEDVSHQPHFHNLFVDIAVRYGLHTFIVFVVFVLSIIYYSLKCIVRMDRREITSSYGLGLVASFAVFMTIISQNCFSSYAIIIGYSCSNCFLFISCGVIAYCATRLDRKAS